MQTCEPHNQTSANRRFAAEFRYVKINTAARFAAGGVAMRTRNFRAPASTPDASAASGEFGTQQAH
jgi:hypothetical protein